jgi:predicted phage-related endonuclease
MSEQGSQEWRQDRSGRWTASKFADLIAADKLTGKPLKCRADAIWNCVVERMTGEPVEGPGGFALQWGSDVEEFSREAFELATGKIVEQVGFIAHPKYAFAGASPDGLIGDDEGLELKCPRSSSVHLARFLAGVPAEYMPQIQGCMWVTGRKKWYFASFDPRMPPSHQLLIIPVLRDEAVIAAIEAAVLTAEAEAVELQQRIERMAA